MDATWRFSLALSYYGRLCRKVLAARFLLLTFLVAASLHAVGHGLTAVIAGFLGRALVADTRFISSTFRFLSNPATVDAAPRNPPRSRGAGRHSRIGSAVTVGAKGGRKVRHRVAGRLLDGNGAGDGHCPLDWLSVCERSRRASDGLLGGVRVSWRRSHPCVALWRELEMALGALLVVTPFASAWRARRAWRRPMRTRWSWPKVSSRAG
jgi:hypothetical protein